MTPLNRAERNKAFIGFLVLVVITLVIVITVAFFSLRVQLTEYESLRSRVLVLQNEKNLSDTFRVAMDVTLNELTKFDSKKEPAIVTKGKVQLKIARLNRIMRNYRGDLPENERTLYDLVIQSLADLNDAKTRIRNLEDQKN
jgi:hypothetical protein